MRKVTLGTTGLVVSRLGLGTDVLHAGGLSVEEHTAIILRAWELGINLIDTDRWYDTYPSIAAALPHVTRRDVVLVSKTYEKTRDAALADVAYALEALGTEYLDLFLLHAVDSMEQYAEMAGALEGLQEARERGWIRHIGLSTHAVPVVSAIAGHPDIEAILTVVNLKGKNMHRTGTRDGMEHAVARVCDAGQGVYVMKPFARGRLFDDANKDKPLTPEQAEEALRYLYGLPTIHAVVPGIRSIAQLEHCVRVVEALDG